jgi:hypothetical protein
VLTPPEPSDGNRIALWVVPRSVSTAFERVFIERGDTTVIHEPFGVYYYNSTERRHDRFIDAYPPRPEYEFDAILRRILAPHDKPLWFMKDMPYHVTARLSAEFAARFRNTFLIRDPEDAIPSHFRLSPDLTPEEAGYRDQRRLFDISMNECGQPPVVVDADDFRRHPEEVMRRYCAALGIEHLPQALQWERREIDIWKISQAWHKDALDSTGIAQPKPREPVDLHRAIRELIDHCRADYLELYRHRIVPSQA